MTNEITTTAPAPVAAPLTEAQKNAWVGMAVAKNQIAAELQNAELAAQSILIPMSTQADHKIIDAVCADYRKKYTDMVEHRKTFTGLLEAGVIAPLMAYEKRIDPKSNETYLGLQKRSLTLRQAEADKAAKANAKNAEIASFKAHCANEFYRINEDLRGRIRAEVSTQYRLHLESRLSPQLDDLAARIAALPTDGIQKFTPKLLNGAELTEIFMTLNRPDVAAVYAEGNELLHKTFANFDSDLANAAAAIAYNEQQKQLADAEAPAAAAQEMAMNTIIAIAETVQIDAPKIKKTMVVQFVESDAWAVPVMAAFITNRQHLIKYVRVKSWANLTVGQMAGALGQLATETGATYQNLILNEIQK